MFSLAVRVYGRTQTKSVSEQGADIRGSNRGMQKST